MKLVEVAAVGEFLIRPDAFYTFDEFPAPSRDKSVGILGREIEEKCNVHLYRSACSSHHCPMLVNSALNQPDTTLIEIRPFV